MQLVSTFFTWATVTFRLAVALVPLVYVGSLYQQERFAFIIEHNIVIWSFVWMFVWLLFSFSPTIWSSISVATALEEDDEVAETDEAATAKERPVKVRRSKTPSTVAASDDQTDPHPFVEDVIEFSPTSQLQLL